MMKILNKKHLLVLVGSLLFIALVYITAYQLMIRPQKEEAESLQQQVTMFEEQITIQSTEEDEQVTKGVDTINRLIPSYLAADSLLREIQTLANESQVRISYIGTTTENMEVANAEETEEVSSLVQKASYSMDMTGENLQDVNVFLDAIKTGDRLITIDTLNVQQDGESVFAQITFSTYYAQ